MSAKKAAQVPGAPVIAESVVEQNSDLGAPVIAEVEAPVVDKTKPYLSQQGWVVPNLGAK